MKKLLTIICALSLVLAFSMPASAIDDIEDNQAGVALLGQTNQAQKGGEIDNDGLDVDTGDIASGNSLDNDTTDVDVTTGDLLSGNTDDHSNNSTNTSDTDGTDVDVTTGDLLSNNTDNSINDNDGTDVDVAATDVLNDKSDDDVLDNKGGTIGVSDIANDKSQDNDDNSINTDNSDQGNVDVAVDDINVSDVANDKSDDDVLDNKGGNIEVSDIANDKSQDNDDSSTNDSYNDNSQDNDDSSINTDVAFDDVVDMKGNDAAAAFGGFALAIDIDDIELNLASTTSVNGIYQNSEYEANAGLAFDDASTEFESKCLSVDASVYSNTGITGANFSAGNFNNQANLNSVTMTIQH
jgi:hypothetical protein